MRLCRPSTLCAIIIFCEALLGFTSLPIQTFKQLLVAEIILHPLFPRGQTKREMDLSFSVSLFYYQGFYSFLEAMTIKTYTVF